MAKTKTAHAYELELRKMIKSRTGADMEAWLLPQRKLGITTQTYNDCRLPYKQTLQLQIKFHR